MCARGPFVARHFDRDSYKRYAALVFETPAQQRAARRIIDNTKIDARYLVATPERILTPRPLAEKSADYARHARELGEHVARRDIVRLPITELGCAGGAAALSRAREHVRAYPEHTVLVLSIELPSLTFQKEDLSMTNLVAASIFGDGAAACVVRGPRAPGGVTRPGPMLVDSLCHIYPETQYLMGFELEDGGFHIVLDRDVPHALKGRVRPLVEQLCARNGVDADALRFCALHPGGRRILEDLDADLGLTGLTEPSWNVLRDYGNLSSATVLFVLDEVLRRAPPPVGRTGCAPRSAPDFPPSCR